MADVDTSAEAVERLALSLLIADQPVTAATLRALLAERDAIKRERGELRQRVQDAEKAARVTLDEAQRAGPCFKSLLLREALTQATTERDAARAQRDRMREALLALLARDERNTCTHEDTHRGGTIWEICDCCGAKWADDQGGRPKWQDPPEWVAARAALAADPTPAAALEAADQSLRAILAERAPDLLAALVEMHTYISGHVVWARTGRETRLEEAIKRAGLLPEPSQPAPLPAMWCGADAFTQENDNGR